MLRGQVIAGSDDRPVEGLEAVLAYEALPFFRPGDSGLLVTAVTRISRRTSWVFVGIIHDDHYTYSPESRAYLPERHIPRAAQTVYE